jgi:hypothetical protein
VPKSLIKYNSGAVGVEEDLFSDTIAAWDYVTWLMSFIRNNKDIVIPTMANDIKVIYKAGSLVKELRLNAAKWNKLDDITQATEFGVLEGLTDLEFEALFEAAAEYELCFVTDGKETVKDFTVRVRNTRVGRLSDAFINVSEKDIKGAIPGGNALKAGQGYRPEGVLLPRDLVIKETKLIDKEKVYPTSVSPFLSFGNLKWDADKRVITLDGPWNGWYYMDDQYRVSYEHKISEGREAVKDIFDEAYVYALDPIKTAVSPDWLLPIKKEDEIQPEEGEDESTISAPFVLIYRFVYNDSEGEHIAYMTGIQQRIALGTDGRALSANTLMDLWTYGPILEQLVLPNRKVVSEDVMSSLANAGFESIKTDEVEKLVVATVRLYKQGSNLYEARLTDPMSLWGRANDRSSMLYQAINKLSVAINPETGVQCLLYYNNYSSPKQPFTMYSTRSTREAAWSYQGHTIDGWAQSCVFITVAGLLGSLLRVDGDDTEDQGRLFTYGGFFAMLEEAIKYQTGSDNGLPLFSMACFYPEEKSRDKAVSNALFKLVGKAFWKKGSSIEGLENLKKGCYYLARTYNANKTGHSFTVQYAGNGKFWNINDSWSNSYKDLGKALVVSEQTPSQLAGSKAARSIIRVVALSTTEGYDGAGKAVAIAVPAWDDKSLFGRSVFIRS